MRAWLGDSRDATGREPPPRVYVGLDDDVLAAVDVEIMPTLAVRCRVREGFDANGDPEYGWAIAVEDVAILWEERQETDSVAGVTRTLADAVILYDSDTIVTEAAMVVSSFGGVWRIASVSRLPDRLEMQLVRSDGT